MKQWIRRLLVLGAALALAGSVTALCAGESAPAPREPVIAVQLDGEALTFPDAVPQVKDSRTFLPFRAVFEAMGAQVSYEDGRITAVRGDKTLTMTIGEASAAVTTGGVTVPLQMDVAPYVDNATWRTYVPVRFAAQALGCAVGWDQEACTVILVDTDKLVSAALEGKHFTYLDKYMAYTRRFREGIWNTDMAVTGSLGMTDEDTALSFPLSAALHSVTQDQSKLEMGMNVKVDMSAMLQLLLEDAIASGAPAVIEPEEQAMVDALANEGIDLALRGDLEEGGMAFTASGELLSTLLGASLPKNVWYTMDLAALYSRMGTDYAALLNTTGETDYAALVKLALAEPDVNSAQTGYADARRAVEETVALFTDEAFVKEGSNYTTACTVVRDDTRVELGLTLIMPDDAVVGYTMDVTVTTYQSGADVSLEMQIAMDENDQLTGRVHTGTDGSMTMDLDITGGYTRGETAPQTQPPEGAGVIDLNALIPSPL